MKRFDAIQAFNTTGTIIACVFLAASCAGLLPVKVVRKVALQQVERRVNGATSVSRNIETSQSNDGTLYAFADDLLSFSFRFEQNRVLVEVINKSGNVVAINWDRSRYVDEQNQTYQLAAAGWVSAISRKREPFPPSLAAGAKVNLRLSKKLQDASKLGITQPFFIIDRANKEIATKRAEALLGKVVRIVLTFESQGVSHEYAFHCQLVEVRVGKDVIAL